MYHARTLQRKPAPGDVVLDSKGREYVVKTIGTKLVYVTPIEGGPVHLFGIRDITLKPEQSVTKSVVMTPDEEFLA